ncbi:MAG: DNA mismatch repair endonuclease MutL, partial [Oscillospiraceae bacterium]
MSTIHVLPKAVSELIAAGEVIERPASVVKELIENSIDAGATAITVEIQNGGVRFIRITDNGSGISADDAPTSFLRHATSKVTDASDLDCIGTLGFRGEALASITAVSKVEMMTKTATAELGTYVKICGSELQEVRETGCPSGTTITIRDIFYNVPARLKFLKKDVTEGNAVSGIVDKIALSHPEIAVKLIRDNKVTFHTPGDGKLLSAVYTIFGKEFAQNMLPVEYEYGGVRVTGLTGKPMFHRANRAMQHFFINGRYAQSRTCSVATGEAYRGAMMIGKFPACVLQLEMPFEQVDVNVHPAKIEVRFVNEKAVFDSVYFAV